MWKSSILNKISAEDLGFNKLNLSFAFTGRSQVMLLRQSLSKLKIVILSPAMKPRVRAFPSKPPKSVAWFICQ